ncbi:MAG: phenylalanine--tRNA ligase subunit alpha [Sulfolobales archaeon]|nr:phenylalanine--tRNA ligase subunit alpha [Sulfolobales archaeon]MCX8208842.1 phenylalanine--tRNA ligase subunit alpha [Sulfolobales archaeon]
MSSPQEIKLPPRLYAIARVLSQLGEASAAEIAKLVGRKVQDIMRDLAELESRGFVETFRKTYFRVELSELGRKYLSGSLPEEVIFRELLSRGSLSFIELKELGLGKDEVEAAIGVLKSLNSIRVAGGRISLVESSSQRVEEYVQRLREGLRRYSVPVMLTEVPASLWEVRKRGFITIREHREVFARATELLVSSSSKLVEGEVVTVVTPEIIKLDSWDSVEFKAFDISVELPRATVARKHFFNEVLDYMRELMVSMGFEEVKGPHVELELWNFDALFVPQHHPARRPTDVYYVDRELSGSSSVGEVLDAVGRCHRTFRGYNWDPRKALRLVLRTHCTSVSARVMWERGAGEYRVFTIDRVFRPDTPDPTHLMEFHQLDGIIVGRRVSFKDLLQFFREFSRGMGLGEVRFKPAYFPFTEPSVEGYVKHPKLGWIEVLPGGMFRRQVLEPLGLKELNVAAWGIGVDRIAMILLGIDDIRELYTDDVKEIERTPIPRVVLGGSSFG